MPRTAQAIPSAEKNNVRHITLVSGLITSCLISGIVYGWPALVVVFNRERTYHTLCEDTSLDCDERKLRLSLIYTLGSSAIFISHFVFGFFMDVFGPRVTVYTGGALTVAGSLCMAVSDPDSPDGVDAFMPGYFLLGCGGPCIHLSLFSFSSLFPQRRATVTSLIVGVFTASGFVFVLFNVLHSAVGWSRRTLFLLHSILSLMLVANAWWVFPATPFREGDVVVRAGCTTTTLQHQRTLKVSAHSSSQSLHATTLDVELEMTSQAHTPERAVVNAASSPSNASPSLLSSPGSTQGLLLGVSPAATTSVADNDGEDRAVADTKAVMAVKTETTTERQGRGQSHSISAHAEVLLAAPFSTQALSTENLFLVCWFTMHVLRIQWVIGSAADQLQDMGDSDERYTEAVGYIIPGVGVSLVLLPGWVTDKHGAQFAVLAADVFAFLYGSLLCIPVVELQILTYVCVALSRSFMFSSAFAYWARTFGYGNFGKLAGLGSLAAAIVAQAQIGLAVLSVESEQGYLLGNLIVMLVSAPLAYFGIWITRPEQQQQQQQQRQQQANSYNRR